MQIPLTRLDHWDPPLMEQLLGAVERVARSGAFTLGEEVLQFEADFAAYCGTAHAIGVSSGTEALALVLRALDVGVGDEVIVPANSFIATAEAVSLVGATPRFVDVDPATAVMTADSVEAAVGSSTRCVMPVHLYGRTVELAPILAVAERNGLAVIEDACQAHGAWLGDARAGSLGIAGCFSFYPAKNLGAWGDGGAVVTSDPTLDHRIRLLRAHGERTRYHHEVVGTTARLDALQAAVLRVKLQYLDTWNDGRRRAGAALARALEGGLVRVPTPATPDSDHVFHQFVVEVEDRDGLRDHLASRGIATAIHYPVPIHRTAAYSSSGMVEGSLPVTERLAGRICSLPMHHALSDDEIDQIAEAVTEFAAATTRSEGPFSHGVEA